MERLEYAILSEDCNLLDNLNNLQIVQKKCNPSSNPNRDCDIATRTLYSVYITLAQFEGDKKLPLPQP